MCITHGHTTYECIQFIKGALESDSICACMHILYDRVYIIRYVFDNIYSIDIIYIYICMYIYIHIYIYTIYAQIISCTLLFRWSHAYIYKVDIPLIIYYI